MVTDGSSLSASCVRAFWEIMCSAIAAAPKSAPTSRSTSTTKAISQRLPRRPRRFEGGWPNPRSSLVTGLLTIASALLFLGLSGSAPLPTRCDRSSKG